MATTSSQLPVLDLDTLVSNPLVAIDGKPYPLRMPDTLTLIEYRRMAYVLPRLEDLWEKAADLAHPLSPKDERELRQLFREITGIVLQAPEAVRDKLVDLQHVAIYHSFLRLPQDALRRAEAMVRGAGPNKTIQSRPSNGGRSSVVSSSTTAAPPQKTGSRGRRSPSSKLPSQ